MSTYPYFKGKINFVLYFSWIEVKVTLDWEIWEDYHVHILYIIILNLQKLRQTACQISYYFLQMFQEDEWS